LGSYAWDNNEERDRVVRRIIEILKTKPDLDKRKILDSFPELLKVSVSSEFFAGMFLSWDTIREMSNNGIVMGAHTVSHPILTRVSLSDAKAEISNSKNRIEDELGCQIYNFAYPNGQRTDYNSEIIESVKAAGLQAAYTLLPGPTKFDTVKENPYEIRRIFLSYKDTFPRFAAKLSGLSRIYS
jgi:hypothetical protein